MMIDTTILGTSPIEVHLIDIGFIAPGVSGVYLLRSGQAVGLVDVGTSLTLPHLLAELEIRGVMPADITHIFITHAHLDHCGALTQLLRQCPNAQAYAHPAAIPHLVYPKVLVISSKKVFGNDTFKTLFGEVHPTPAEHLVPLVDGAELYFGHGTLRAMHVRGHSDHHYILFEPQQRLVFSGDSFGACFGFMKGRLGGVALPLTPPTQYDGDALLQTIDQILSLRPSLVLPTHCGAILDCARAAAQLQRYLNLAHKVIESGAEDIEVNRICLDLLLGNSESLALPLTEAHITVLRDEVCFNTKGIRAFIDAGVGAPAHAIEFNQ